MRVGVGLGATGQQINLARVSESGEVVQQARLPLTKLHQKTKFTTQQLAQFQVGRGCRVVQRTPGTHRFSMRGTKRLLQGVAALYPLGQMANLGIKACRKALVNHHQSIV